MQIESYIDHTLLKQDAREKDIEKLCSEARQYGFFSVCVNPFWIPIAAGFLSGSHVKIATVAGFPLGANIPPVKLLETELALEAGADEIDMVINIGRLKDNDTDYVTSEIRRLKAACGDKVLKVIVETCLLTEEEKKTVCKCVMEGGADFIKTSTGFSTAGASIEDIRLFRSIAGKNLKIKASGGIGDYKTAIEMIEAGADRLGTSRSVVICKGGGL